MTARYLEPVAQTEMGPLRAVGVSLEDCVLVRKGRIGGPQRGGRVAGISAVAGSPTRRWL